MKWWKWLSLLHNFIPLSFNSGPVQVQILLAACHRFAMVRISDNGCGWKRLLSVKHSTKIIHHHYHLFKFQEFINDLEKIFHWQKQNFAPTGNFANTTEVLTQGKALLILLLFYLQMIMMPISSQKDNQGYRKSAATKESTLFKKIVLKFWNPKFNNLCKIAFIYFTNINLLEFGGQ